METIKKTLMAFHTGRGGRFNNAGHTTFIGEGKSINEFTSDLFLNFENTKEVVRDAEDRGLDVSNVLDAIADATNGNNTPFTRMGFDVQDLGALVWADCNGNEVGLNFENDGTGSIDLDGQYNTTTVDFLENLSENEAQMVLDSNTWKSQDTTDYLLEKFNLKNA